MIRMDSLFARPVICSDGVNSIVTALDSEICLLASRKFIHIDKSGYI
jgi:hypothetical protein